jgi:hypothetical protein
MSNRTLPLGWIAFLTAFLFVASAKKAHAYIDAGTGSYLLQVGMGAALAAAFAVRMSWLRLKQFALRALWKRRDGTDG